MLSYIFSNIKCFLVYIWESELMSLFRMQPELWIAGLNRRKCGKCSKPISVDNFRKRNIDITKNEEDGK